MLEGLAAAAVRTLLLAGAVQCVLWLLRVRHTHLLLASWTVVLAASLAMPLIQQVAPLRVQLDPAIPESIFDGASDLLPWPPPQDIPGPLDTVPQPTAPAVPWVAVIYLAVSAAMLTRVALGVCLSMRLLFRATPTSLEWTRGARVRISRDVTSPVTIANVILLPPDAPGWSAAMRLAVLAHEQAHVQRWDFAMLVLSQLNRGLFWFSPLPWWLHRRLVALTELASDDRAIACLSDPLRYAEILLEMGRRSGPVFHGPAMARPATLSHRIDRILSRPAPCCPATTSQLVLLAAGVAGLSLGVASTVSQPVRQPAIAAVLGRWDTLRESLPTDADGREAAEQGPAIRQALEPAQAPPVPQIGAGHEARSVTAVTSPGAVVGTPRPPSRTWQPAMRQAVPAAPRNVPPAPRTAPATMPRPADRSSGEAIRRTGTVADNAAPQPARGAAIPAPTGGPETDLVQRLPTRAFQPQFPAPALPADFRHIMGATCEGNLAIGPNAQSSPERQPFLVPGQTVAARAHFHLRADGTAWVRFDAFGQRPLELPLRFTGNGVAWTGEYGIAYTVRASGDHSLIGLAAFFRNDSARMDLTCSKSPADAV